MVSTYIQYLPKYNSPEPKFSATSAVIHFHNDHNSNNSFIKLHGAFKSVPENKRKAINLLIKTEALVFLLVFSGLALPGLIRKPEASLSIFLNPHQRHYLSLCTLRI